MDYLTLRAYQKNVPFFSLTSIRLQEPTFRVDQLLRWQKKSYIRPIIRGWSIFTDVIITEELLMLIANKLISPSYISLELAFSIYHLIPEGVFQITSVTSKKTRQFNTELTTFSYRHIKPSLMFGYYLRDSPFGKICIADLEKALLDFLYLTPQANDQNMLEEMRFNSDILAKLDWQKFDTYLKIFNHRALSKRAKRFLKYVTHQ